VETRRVFVTGGTGYMGTRLIERLAARGHAVRALARAGSAERLPRGAEPVIGDALAAASYASAVPPCDTFVHLIGTPHPNPSKAAEFERVDLASAVAAVSAATAARVRHFVYVSVAQPAPVMRAYLAARAAAEAGIRASGLDATILRPWYVLGPGHRWPYVLVPAYRLAERIPRLREGARRLGLVTIGEMAGALVCAVEDPAAGVRIVDVPGIRAAGRRNAVTP
jgi:uncharacterized protein YbjT (DUF2867 family)